MIYNVVIINPKLNIARKLCCTNDTKTIIKRVERYFDWIQPINVDIYKKDLKKYITYTHPITKVIGLICISNIN